jgi:long-subunit fatty acid transport protein
MKTSGYGITAGLILGVLSTLALPVNAQFYYDPIVVYEAATENPVLPGARASGMGGAQIAGGMDGSVLWYNPALLTRITRSELSGTLAHQRFTNETAVEGVGAMPDANVSNTRLGSLWGTYKIPTYQGGMVVGFGVNRVRSFDRIFRYASSPTWLNNPYASSGWGGGEDESGSLWAWTFGGGIEISPQASVGLSIDIFDGDDDYSYFFDSTETAVNYSYNYSHTINDDYTGVSGKIGFNYDLNNNVSLAGIIGFPSSITVDQTSETYEYDNQGFDSYDYFTSSYRYTLPFWIGLGAQAKLQDLTLAGDVSYIDYSQLRYRSGLEDLGGLNLTARQYYEETFTFRVGAEYIIRPSGTRLRAGYYQEPVGFQGFDIKTEPHFFTFGAGFLVDRSVMIDLAFLTGSWEREDPTIYTVEKYKANRFMMTISYRL